jgi:hypothetical protein
MVATRPCMVLGSDDVSPVNHSLVSPKLEVSSQVRLCRNFFITTMSTTRAAPGPTRCTARRGPSMATLATVVRTSSSRVRCPQGFGLAAYRADAMGYIPTL